MDWPRNDETVWTIKGCSCWEHRWVGRLTAAVSFFYNYSARLFCFYLKTEQNCQLFIQVFFCFQIHHLRNFNALMVNAPFTNTFVMVTWIAVIAAMKSRNFVRFRLATNQRMSSVLVECVFPNQHSVDYTKPAMSKS